MEIDPNNYYRMPLIMGPQWVGDTPNFHYSQTEIVALQYLTDPNAISVMLPACYRLGKEPQVTVLFGYNNGLDFMAGGGYILAAVQVSACFDGEKDHVEGDYVLVMFENQAWPMICGREDLGIPKLYADISPIKIYSNGRLRCEATYWGHLLFSLELSPQKKQNRLVKYAANKIINSRPWLGYKYIPSLAGPPDAEYPTISYNDTNIDNLWFSKTGKIEFGNATSNEIGQVEQLINALKALPILEVKQALHFVGSATLRYDLSRRLE
jgi:acetoacetate decarboxylase